MMRVQIAVLLNEVLTLIQYKLLMNSYTECYHKISIFLHIFDIYCN